MKILVTGVAGFIGHRVTELLLEEGHEVVGLDNINDYYDVSLKYDRLSLLGIERSSVRDKLLVPSIKFDQFSFIKADLCDADAIQNLFELEDFDVVCHLAAQGGVRYSLENPRAYTSSNIDGFLNILEACRWAVENNRAFKNLVFASSSSVYGFNETVPFKESHNVDHPVSLYAATKKANELMAHTYANLYGVPATGLRFFTVYGPWGRPDMAPILFSKAITAGEAIKVFNNGDMARDFTYIDDIVYGIIGCLKKPAQPNVSWSGKEPDPSTGKVPYRVYNIGNGSPVKLMDFISTLEGALGQKAEKNFMPMQPGDVKMTWADTTALETEIGYKPKVSIKEGVEKFAAWYREYYNI